MLNRRAIGTLGWTDGIHNHHPLFTKSLLDLYACSTEILCAPGDFIHTQPGDISGQAAARNRICDQTRGDWVFQIDTDMTCHPDTLARMVHLMYQEDLDVVTGIYFYKQPPHAPVLFLYQPREGRGDFVTVTKWDPQDHLISHPDISAGGGCLLIRKRALEKIYAAGEKPFNIQEGFSEDHSFFLRCRRLQIPIHIATRCTFEHLATCPVGIQDYRAAGIDQLPPHHLHEALAYRPQAATPPGA